MLKQQNRPCLWDVKNENSQSIKKLWCFLALGKMAACFDMWSTRRSLVRGKIFDCGTSSFLAFLVLFSIILDAYLSQTISEQTGRTRLSFTSSQPQHLTSNLSDIGQINQSPIHLEIAAIIFDLSVVPQGFYLLTWLPLIRFWLSYL